MVCMQYVSRYAPNYPQKTHFQAWRYLRVLFVHILPQTYTDLDSIQMCNRCTTVCMHTAAAAADGRKICQRDFNSRQQQEIGGNR